MSTIDICVSDRREAFHLDVAVSIPAAGVTGILGASGSGKTSLLRVIAGLDRIDGADVSVAGEIWQSQAAFVPTHERSLGYVFQEPGLFAHLNVQQNLEYGLRRTKGGDGGILNDCIGLLGLQSLLQRKPATLSGGERQRVAIARALAAGPRLLLMDEPLSGLDQARKDELMPYLQALHRELECPLIYVSHSLEEIARLADHLILVDRGKITGSGTAAELFARLDLPLSFDDSAAAIIDTEVAATDDFGLLSLTFADGSLLVPAQNNYPAGTPVRVCVAAKDVSLTLERQTATSILNILPAVVSGIEADGDAQCIVRLELGKTTLLSRISRKSADDLKLVAGAAVYAQVKAAAVLS